MFLETLTIQNFRKFRSNNNTIHFVASKSINKSETKSSLIAPSSTLIIGKNNTGKTTIAKALSLISEKKKPKISDFNMDYLRETICLYEKSIEDNVDTSGLETPYLEFKLAVRVNIEESEDVRSDLINNLYQFVPISSETPDLVSIIIKYEIKEEEAFRNQLQRIIKQDYSNIKGAKLVALKKLESLSNFQTITISPSRR